MNNSPQFWIILRAIVILVASLFISSYDVSKSYLDWLASLIVPIVGGVGVYVWLMLSEKRQAIDWTKPISITQPFFPMSRYPIRYWLVAAISLTLGGSVALLKEIMESGQHPAFGATFLFLGIAILIAIGALMRMRSNKRPV